MEIQLKFTLFKECYVTNIDINIYRQDNIAEHKIKIKQKNTEGNRTNATVDRRFELF